MKLFKSRKTYYMYNPNTLSYERVYPSAKDRFLGVLRHLSIGIIIGVGRFLHFIPDVRFAGRVAFEKGEQTVADAIRSVVFALGRGTGCVGRPPAA